MTKYALTTGAGAMSATPRARAALALGWLAAAVLAAGCQDASAPEESPAALGAQKADVADAAVPATGVGTASTVSNFQGWGPIPTGSFNSGPAVTSPRVGNIELFARGLDNQMYRNCWLDPALPGGTGYSGWQPMGRRFTSKPSATFYGSGGLAVVAKGTDNAIWMTERGGPCNGRDEWQPVWWRMRGGTFNSAPAIAYDDDGKRLFVFARKSDNMIYWTSFSTSIRDYGGWSSWKALPGGTFKSEPAAASVGSGLQVVAKGMDDGIWRNQLVGSSWSGWSELPYGVFKSGPAISSPAGSCHVDVFGRGLDDFVWVSTSEDCGDSWTGFDRIPGGTVTSSPAAWASSRSRVELVAKGGDNAIARNTAQ